MSVVSLPAGDIYVPVKIEDNDLYGGIFKLLKAIRPNWNRENIKFKVTYCNIYSSFKSFSEILLLIKFSPIRKIP